MTVSDSRGHIQGPGKQYFGEVIISVSLTLKSSCCKHLEIGSGSEGIDYIEHTPFTVIVSLLLPVLKSAYPNLSAGVKQRHLISL